MEDVLIRETEMKQNKDLFEQVREENKGKKEIIPHYPDAYWEAKELLEKKAL